MGQKFAKFMNALGGALNPEVFRINAANQAAETANRNLENRTRKDNDLKALMQGLSMKSSLIQQMGIDDPNVKKIVGGARDSILNADIDESTRKNLMGSFGDELALTAGLGIKKPTPSEITKLQREVDDLGKVEQTSRVKTKISQKEARIAKLTTVTGRTAQDLSTSQKGKLTLAGIEGEVNLRNNVREMGQLVETMSSPDFLGGLTGDAVQGLNSARQQVTQLFGGEEYLTADGTVNPEAFAENSSFRKKAIQGSLAESQQLELAFILAKSLNPDGKISDADVRQAGMILGEGADPKVRSKLLKDAQRRIVAKYNTEQGVIARRLKKPFTPFKLKELEGAIGGVGDRKSPSIAKDKLKSLGF